MRKHLVASLILTAVMLTSAFAATNNPGSFTDFTVPVAAGNQSLTLEVLNDNAIGSHVLVKFGAPFQNNQDFQYASMLDGQPNRVGFERPELLTGNCFVRVLTPASAPGPHTFTLTTMLDGVVRSANFPAEKAQVFSATGAVNTGGDHYFRFRTPANYNGGRIVLSTNNASTIYLRDDNANGSYITSSSGSTLHTLLLSPAALMASHTYCIQIHADTSITYNLDTENVYARTLTWDAGTAPGGSAPIAQPNAFGGDYLFEITTQTPLAGAWRQALKVNSGEANLYMSTGIPSTTSYIYKSDRTGSDGLILDNSQFQVNQVWYLLIHATRSATWSVFSGDIFVHDLGQLAPFSSSASSSSSLPAQFRVAANSHEVPIGPEGVVYFKTSVPGNTKAWRLWLEGKTNDIFVQKSTAPVAPSHYELTEAGQMLVVPAYLVNATYFVGIPGDPGSSVALDSRQQQIRDPGADDFNFTLNGTDDGGYGFVTYQIDIPINQIAWQTKCTPTAGNADLYIRRGNVPNRNHNDGYSEAPNSVTDSVTLVPPSLTNGTWYVTVYGSASFSFTLSSGNPVITPIAFINDDATPANLPKSSGAHITNNAPAQSGWRYYQINNIESQLGTLGWELFLASQVQGTEIALRRNAVPGRWNYRDSDAGYSYTSFQVDFTSTAGFLQRPGHQADIWYIGIYIPDQALGAFQLTTREIGSPDLTFNGGNVNVTNSPADLWKYFRVTIPSGGAAPLGWDLRLYNVTSGLPEMVVRRDLLPEGTGSTTFFPYFYNNWPLGAQWQAPTDWSNRYYAADGSNETSRVMAAGMGSPLEPGTYYVGVRNNATSGPMTYSVRSRGIGIGNDSGGNPWGVQVQTLAFSGAGGTATFSGLAPRDAKYYKVTIPANTKSWSLSMTPTVGECLLGVRRGALPNSELASSSSEVFDGARRQIDGREFFYKHPTQAQGDFIPAGDYYVVVASEGETPTDDYHIGANPSSYTVSSHGEVVVDDRTGQSLTTTSPVTWTNQTVVFGSQRVYRFHVPANIESMEIRLKNVGGGPGMALHQDPTGAGHVPTSYAIYNQYHADEGGYNYDKGHQSLIISAQPGEGDYTIVVRADSTTGSNRPDATFELEVTVKQAALLAFNGGAANVSLQAPDTFEYFKVIVPPGALGWDLRLKNVTSGAPELIVRRDLLPSDYGSTSGFPYYYGSWPSGHQWQGYLDWTNRNYTADAGAITDTTRVMAMGMNNPLEPGTYYVGVRNVGASGPLSYTIQSRGIGIGNDSVGIPWAIQVQPLTFTGPGSTVMTSNVAPREAAYYRVDVPAGASSWSMQAVPSAGECMMALHFGSLPNVTEGYGTEDDAGYHGGAYRQKDGAEYFYKYPTPPNATIASGSYYIAVISEGHAPADQYHIGTGSVNFTVTCNGTAPINDKTAELLTGNHPIQWFGESLLYGQQKIYRFRVPGGVESMEVRLLNRQGGPGMALRADPQGSGRISSSYSPWTYYRADEGGYSVDRYDDSLITAAQPQPGDYTLVVRADSSTGFDYPDANYDVQVTIRQTIPLNFNGDQFTMSNQEPDTWQYFRITVPPDALGWDLRLTDVTSGVPELVACRDQLPDQITTSGFFPNYYNHWSPGFVWSPSYDWTGRYYTADPGAVNEPSRILAMGMDNPLSPGTYFIGVKNYSPSSPMSYTLVSRGIGINNDSNNQPWALQVRDLQFSGAGSTVSGANLAPREAAYYRVTVPSNAKSWSLQLTPTAGEAMLAMRFNAVPNIAVSTSIGSDEAGYFGGTKRQKSGQEWFYKYPTSPNTTIAPGTYYIAVVGEGVNPVDDYHVGTGSSSFSLTSNGEVTIDDKTSTVLSPANPVAWTGQSLAYGQQKQYRFRIPPGVISAEIQLRNVVGGPAMSLRGDPVGLGRIPYSYSPFSYYRADEGGFDPSTYNSTLITVPEPATGDYTLTVRADSTGGDRPAAQYDIQVSALTVTTLNLDAVQNAGGGTNVAANKHLDNQQVHYYKVVVPQSMTLPNGEPIAGWKLDVAEATGDVIIRARRGAIPNQEGIGVLNRNELHTAIVAPYLQPGDWFVEVYGNGISDYTLTSSIIRPKASWTMPTVEGVTFGDSGEQDLGSNDFHFFKITVPNGNKGLFHTKLEAVSGDPDLYIRETGVPTRSHGDPTVYWYAGSIYDRYQTGSGTAYGNWVPLDGRVEAQLRPGDWWVMVYASGSSNVRYRLVATTGDVQNLNRDTGSFTSQNLAAGDMRYYKVTDATPDTNWNLTFTERFGDGVMFIRDTIPPGFGYYLGAGYGASIDWYNDNMTLNPNPYLSYDDSGTHQFSIPPVKPGATYYVGIYAKNDLTFDISSSTSGGQFTATNIPFYSGSAAATLNPGEARIYRIDTPPDAFYWHHQTTHDATVVFRIAPGTVPPEDGYAAFSSYSADHSFDYPLSPATFPWQPNRTYYMLVRNTDTVPHPFTFQMAGIPPTVVSFTPADNSTNVPIDTEYTITFDRPANPGSGYVYIYQAASGYVETSFYVGLADITFAGNTVTIHPSTNLTPRTDYYVTFEGTCFLGEFNARCRGVSGSTTWNFRTTDAAPAPVLDSISPNSTGYGGPDFDLYINGSNFVSNTVVRWAGKPDLIPKFQTATQLVVTVPASYIAAKATADVSVFTPNPGGGPSSAVPFEIVNPQPYISNFGPNAASAGGPSFTMTISGNGFIPESIIHWDGEADLVPATFSPLQLTVLVPASYIATGGYKYFSVFNPGPGGGSTGSTYVTVHNPQPNLIGINPMTVAAGDPAFTLTLNGLHFVGDTQVFAFGTELPVLTRTPTELTVTVPESLIAMSGDIPFSVSTPEPGGGASIVLNLHVVNGVPILTEAVPPFVIVGSTGVHLTLFGEKFAHGAIIKWSGQLDLEELSISPAQIDFDVPDSYISQVGDYTITVINPQPGGGASEPLTFSVRNPAPTLTSINPTSVIAGSGPLVLTLNGTNFISSSIVNWEGLADLTPASIDPNVITVHVPASYVEVGGTRNITVSNQGSSPSEVKQFTIVNLTPTITNISPSTANTGGAGFTMTIDGTNFLSTSKVHWQSQNELTPATVTPTQLTVNIPASYLADGGTPGVTVFNPSPGGGDSNPKPFSISNPLPSLASISPTSIIAGSADFTLTLTGTNFVPSSKVKWPGQADLSAVTQTATQITVHVPAAYVAAAGTASITVTNAAPGGGTSGAQTFTVNNPAPTLASISPNSATFGSPSFTLTLTGTNFIAASVVKWQGQADLTPATASATQLTVTVPASYLTNAGTANVTVFNSAPGGGTSAPQTFTVTSTNPVPSLTGITPNSATVGDAGFTLTLNGSNFVAASVVRWQGKADLTPATTSQTQLTVDVPAGYITAAGTAQITVFNPTPGGGASAAQTFTINNPVPMLDTINPTSVSAGAPTFTLTLTGMHFVSTSVVKWQGQPDLTPATVNATQITVNVPAAYVADGGTRSISVFSPLPGGGTSAPQTLTINNPVPVVTSISPTSAILNSAGFVMTLTGSNFVPSTHVHFGGQNDLTPVSVTATQITVNVPASYLTSIYQAAITAFTPNPGGGMSEPQAFDVVNPAPTLASINPASAILGGSGFTMTLTGTNFVSASVVEWENQNPLAPDNVTSTQITVTVPAAYLLVPGPYAITVRTGIPGGGTTQPQTFTVQNPAPTLTAISPTSAVLNSGPFTLTLDGNFTHDTVVKWPGQADLLHTTFAPTQLTVSVPGSYISASGPVSVTVFTPAPGGGTSSAQTFTVNNPAPALTSISPNTAVVGDAGFTMTLNGSDFVAASVVKWQGRADLTPATSNSSTLTVSVPASYLSGAGTPEITVFNPAPGGGTTAPQTFTITAPSQAPVINSSLAATTEKGQPFSYTITATNNPTSFGAVGLPAGLSISGPVISGTPTISGAVAIVISATNSAGTDTRTLILTINNSTQTNHAPTFVSAPTANPNFTTTGTNVVFTAVTSDADGDALTVVWDFRDGSFNIGSSVTHQFANAGIYNVLVLVSDGHDDLTGSVLVVVNEGSTGGGVFEVQKAAIKFNFAKPTSDSLLFLGTVPVEVGASPAGLVVETEVGSLASTFTLDAKAKATSVDKTMTLKLTVKLAKNGTFSVSPAKFQYAVKKKPLFPLLEEVGFTNENVSPAEDVDVPMVMSFGDDNFLDIFTVKYTAKKGKSGSAKK